MMGHQATQSAAYTISGARKSVVASIEPKESKQKQKQQSTDFRREFCRSPAPSPPSLEERKEYEEEQAKVKAKLKLKGW